MTWKLKIFIGDGIKWFHSEWTRCSGCGNFSVQHRFKTCLSDSHVCNQRSVIKENRTCTAFDKCQGMFEI